MAIKSKLQTLLATTFLLACTNSLAAPVADASMKALSAGIKPLEKPLNITFCIFDIMGTKGDITADMTKNIIEIGLFGQPREVIDVTKLATDFSGHGGGDVRMVLEFLEMITTGKEPQGITSLEQSINSHLVAFAAEESRLNHGAPVEIG